MHQSVFIKFSKSWTYYVRKWNLNEFQINSKMLKIHKNTRCNNWIRATLFFTIILTVIDAFAWFIWDMVLYKLWMLFCSILLDNYFPRQSKNWQLVTCCSININASVVPLRCPLPSLDNKPADKEYKTSKEQYVKQMAVVAQFRHRRHSTHRCTQKATGIVKIIVLHSDASHQDYCHVKAHSKAQ